MKLRQMLFALLAFSSLSTPSFCQTLVQWSKMVVYLQKEFPVFDMKSGERVEVWYKNPATNQLERKIGRISGTGFIVSHNGMTYVVTAKHVANALDNSSTILLNASKDSSISITLAWLHQQPVIPNARWFNHPTADIALHPVCYPAGKLDLLSLGTSSIPRAEKRVNLLTDVIILGFPLGLGVHATSSPIAKKVQVGSDITTVDLPDVSPKLKFYLLDQAVAQGYSGSPVFCSEEIPSGVSIGGKSVSAGEQLTLIGVLSFGLSDATGGKISCVVPISYMWEIFGSSDFQEYEKRLPK